MRSFIARLFPVAALAAITALSASAQVTPAAGYTPPDDTPSVKVGGTIFADFTYIQTPTITDAAGHPVHSDSFNLTRAYINITGNVNHWLAYRITPDVARESGTGSSLNGSLDFRLKYAFAQMNLDDWTNKGSWIRFGQQQTPWIDYEEGIYRYRFQGTTFVDREGFLTSSDTGLSGRWVFPQGYGDIHGGFYNGEGYSKVETNNEKAFQLRASLRPMPLGGLWKGLRIAAFTDQDRPVDGGKRTRNILNATFEHKLINAGFDYLTAKDQALPSAAAVSAKGYSVWATPKLPNHFELLFRYDKLTPNKTITGVTKKRDIEGVAYWFTANYAVLVDRDSLKWTGKATDTRYGLKALVNF